MCLGTESVCASASDSSLVTFAHAGREGCWGRERLAVCAAGGTLDALIPPSITFVVYGIFAEVSIPKLLLAGVMPGILTAFVYMVMIIARALVNHPKLLLLDEPMSALDAKLRKTMQIELKRIQTQVGITFLYVTHDRELAGRAPRTVAIRDGLIDDEHHR